MTPLELDTRSKLTLGFLFAVGCSSHVQIANDATGGQSALYTGGTSAKGGSAPNPDGGAFTNGGYPVSTGTGGYPFNTGTGGYRFIITNTGGARATTETGGQPTTTGGNPPVATGGNPPVATGGNPPATGGAGTGGMDATGGTGVSNVGYPNPPCTLGADQTCNDDVTTSPSTLTGHCGADGSCTCIDTYEVNWPTGKCNTHDQTVCYSPTQNIDKAYVNRAFGCHCNATTPFCGIDSGGLLVYLVCTGGNWQSGDTSNCKS